MADLGISVDFEWLKANVFSYCSGMPVEYSLNYGKDRKIFTLHSITGTLIYGEMKAFDCSDEVGFFLGNSWQRI